MFNKEKTTTPTERLNGKSATLISTGSTLEGDLKSENDLRIDGTIKGNVICSAKIIIGATGLVEGNIDGQQADVAGKVQGNIQVKELLQLRDQCNVEGNIMAGKLQIEPTATFNGQCKMNNSSAANTNSLQKKKNDTPAKEAA
jgi:cytoskeletal protein CcmA (bactofilin family)